MDIGKYRYRDHAWILIQENLIIQLIPNQATYQGQHLPQMGGERAEIGDGQDDSCHLPSINFCTKGSCRP